MKINKTGIKDSPQSLIDEISIINSAIYFQELLILDELISITFKDWDQVKSHFKKDFRFFEPLLFKLHFKRKRNFLREERYHILKFLTIGYYHVADVRYFNEFLFFYRECYENSQLWSVVRKCFDKNIDEHNYHSFPLAKRADVISWIERANISVKLGQISTKQRIGLIGTPIFFSKISEELIRLGFNVKVYFIPFHINKKINYLLNSRIFWVLIKKILQVPKYAFLNYPIDSFKISEVLLRDQNEIGFHKLGFIIKENIFSAFSKGLINDHWGVLPYIRGYSAIEFSLLFGFPVTASTHLIERSIDSGDIIKIFTYKSNDLNTIKSIKTRVKADIPNRAVQSIYRYALHDKKVLKNNSGSGLTFYSIHPSLKNFIEKNVIGKNAKIL